MYRGPLRCGAVPGGVLVAGFPLLLAAWPSLSDPCFDGQETTRAAACAYAQAAPGTRRTVPTVTVRGQSKKTIGTIRELTPGDRACYVTLTDDHGERFEEMASFSLCDRGRELLGKRVRLEYGVANVLAAACQGDMDCGKSDTAVIVETATVLPATR